MYKLEDAIMKLDDILENWKIDCEISKTHLDESSRQTPMLHAKYLEMLMKSKLMLKRLEFQQKVLLRQKWEWYNGKMDQDTIEKLGWKLDPLNGLKVMKGDMNLYYDSDPNIQESEERIQYYKTIIDTLTNIVDTLKWRHQTLRNMIDWRRFESGS